MADSLLLALEYISYVKQRAAAGDRNKLHTIDKDPQLARLKGSGEFVGLERQVGRYNQSMRMINLRH